MEIIWEDGDIHIILEGYKKFDFLWKKKIPRFKLDNNAEENWKQVVALNHIADELNKYKQPFVSAEDVRLMINKLLPAYYEERNKLTLDKSYQPEIFWFSKAHEFLQNNPKFEVIAAKKAQTEVVQKPKRKKAKRSDKVVLDLESGLPIEEMKHLIELYLQAESLWPGSSHSLVEKGAALDEIVKEINFPGLTKCKVFEIITMVNSTYKSEKEKMMKNVSVQPTEKAMESSIWWFNSVDATLGQQFAAQSTFSTADCLAFLKRHVTSESKNSDRVVLDPLNTGLPVEEMTRLIELYLQEESLWPGSNHSLLDKRESLAKITSQMNFPGLTRKKIIEIVTNINHVYQIEKEKIMKIVQVFGKPTESSVWWYHLVDASLGKLFPPTSSIENTCSSEPASPQCVSTNDEKDDEDEHEFDLFGRSVSYQLNNMPLSEAISLQTKLQEAVSRYRLYIDKKVGTLDSENISEDKDTQEEVNIIGHKKVATLDSENITDDEVKNEEVCAIDNKKVATLVSENITEDEVKKEEVYVIGNKKVATLVSENITEDEVKKEEVYVIGNKKVATLDLENITEDEIKQEEVYVIDNKEVATLHSENITEDQIKQEEIYVIGEEEDFCG